MHHFFVEEKNIKKNSIFITDQNDVHHLANVLRVKIGEKLSLSDQVNFYEVEISKVSKNEIETKILSSKKGNENEEEILINVFQCIPKKKKFEEIIDNLTALGVSKIYPVISTNCEIFKGVDKEKLKQRWEKISLEASHQSRRLTPLKIMDIQNLTDIKNFSEIKTGEQIREDAQKNTENKTKKPFTLNLLLNEKEKKITLKDEINALFSPDKSSIYSKLTINLIVGPEGGFTEEEIFFLKDFFTSITLGENILRTELAPVTAVSMLNFAFRL